MWFQRHLCRLFCRRCDESNRRVVDPVESTDCRLDRIFRIQTELMQHFRAAGFAIPYQPVDLTSKYGQRACRDAGLKAVEEIFESLQHFKNWKPHRKTDVPDFDRSKWLEEVVDGLAYQWEMLIIAGVTVDELMSAIESKARKVHRRIDEGY